MYHLLINALVIIIGTGIGIVLISIIAIYVEMISYRVMPNKTNQVFVYRHTPYVVVGKSNYVNEKIPLWDRMMIHSLVTSDPQSNVFYAIVSHKYYWAREMIYNYYRKHPGKILYNNSINTRTRDKHMAGITLMNGHQRQQYSNGVCCVYHTNSYDVFSI